MSDAAGPQYPGRISVLDSVSHAIDWTREVLFRPFDPAKWLLLGFCAWISMLGQGGGGGGGSSGSRGHDHGDLKQNLRHSVDWFLEHLLPILIIGTIVVTVLLILWLLVLWISSRGKFMFVDGVVHNRGAVVEPWSRFRAQGNSLFGFRVILGILGLFIVMGFLATLGSMVWLGAEERLSEPAFVLILVLLVLSVIAIGITAALIGLVIEDFVVPLMYLRRCRVGNAWSEFGELFSARPGPFILYAVVKFFIALITVAIFIAFCCMTCCLVILPYVGTVILLPLHVFGRALPLCFLGQFGSGYERFAGPHAPPVSAGPASPGPND